MGFRLFSHKNFVRIVTYIVGSGVFGIQGLYIMFREQNYLVPESSGSLVTLQIKISVNT